MAISSVYQQLAPSSGPQQIDLGELVGSLSFALDVTEGQPEGHCIRCCYIGTQIGQALGLTGAVLSDLYFTLLLKDLGCSSNAARICELYLTDDIAFKRSFKTLDGSISAALRFVFSQTGLKAGLSDRIRAIVNAVQSGREVSRELIETRCHRGAEIAAKMRFSHRVQDGIRALDEHWNGQGKPDGLKGSAIPLAANIALLSQVVDVFHSEYDSQAAIDEVNARSGTWFAPQLVDVFQQLQQRPGFWEGLRDPDLAQTVFAMQPGHSVMQVDEDFLDDVASAYSDVVDAKSPFTADHSNRVTLYTDMIAEELGLDDAHRRWLRRAALLHDLGKLAVSNQILDKPGKLDAEEWEAIKLHPVFSERILNRVPAFADIAFIAGAHHEKLNGKGYPYGLVDEEIPLEARIMTVADVFDALSAERPYRAAMPVAKALSILDEDIGTAFDGECVAALKRGLKHLDAQVNEVGDGAG